MVAWDKANSRTPTILIPAMINTGQNLAGILRNENGMNNNQQELVDAPTENRSIPKNVRVVHNRSASAASYHASVSAARNTFPLRLATHVR